MAKKKVTRKKQAEKPEESSSRPRHDLKKRLASMQKVADTFSGWKPAREVFQRVKAVETIFPQFDVGTRVGGYPIQRVALVHGPSGHGKTACALGLGLSFLERGHFFGLVDAEMTTPAKWLHQLMAENFDHPGFRGVRPDTYDEVVEMVRDMVTKIAAGVDSGVLEPDTSGLIVIDSLRKLVPKKLLDSMLKGKDGFDGAKGRAAQMKAALNAQWLDELVPLLSKTNTSLLFIGRETENPDAKPWDPKYRVGGGKAVLYDSSLAMRVQRASWVKHRDEIVGEKHRVKIHKTKVGGKSDKEIVAHFHTSNGVLVKPGFDRARDVFELAVMGGQVTRSGSWYTHASTGESWNGEGEAVVELTKDPSTLALLETECREAAAETLRLMEVDPGEEED